MSSLPEAGDFELMFSEELSRRLCSGEALSVDLVRASYNWAGDALGLPNNDADELHVVNIHRFLKEQEPLLRSLSQKMLAQVIFDNMYMH